MNLGIEMLTSKSMTGAELLLLRAVFNLGLAFGFAHITKEHIVPQKPKLQLATFLCFGLGLLLNFSAYQYISAGSVSILQRLDIPLLVLVSLFSVRFSWGRFSLSVLAFLVVFLLAFYTQKSGENPLGYFLILGSVVILSINTLIQKQIAQKENLSTIMLVVSLSSVFWGGIRCWQSDVGFQHLNLEIIVAVLGLAVINLAIFYLVNQLYKKHSPEFVRYPYLISAFGTMVVEMLIKQQWESPVIIFGNMLILILLTLLVKETSKNKIV